MVIKKNVVITCLLVSLAIIVIATTIWRWQNYSEQNIVSEEKIVDEDDLALIQTIQLADESEAQLLYDSSYNFPEPQNLRPPHQAPEGLNYQIIGCTIPQVEIVFAYLRYQDQTLPIGLLGVPKKVNNEWPVTSNPGVESQDGIANYYKVITQTTWRPAYPAGRGIGVIDYTTLRTTQARDESPGDLNGLALRPVASGVPDGTCIFDYQLMYFDKNPLTNNPIEYAGSEIRSGIGNLLEVGVYQGSDKCSVLGGCG